MVPSLKRGWLLNFIGKDRLWLSVSLFKIMKSNKPSYLNIAHVDNNRPVFRLVRLNLRGRFVTYGLT